MKYEVKGRTLPLCERLSSFFNGVGGGLSSVLEGLYQGSNVVIVVMFVRLILVIPIVIICYYEYYPLQ